MIVWVKGELRICKVKGGIEGGEVRGVDFGYRWVLGEECGC